MPEHPRSPADPIPDAPPGDRRSARRVLLGASALLATTGIVYLGVCLADVARQQDPAAVAFTTGEDVVVDLAPGETRIVYLDPVLSGPMSLDVHPDELDCRAEQGTTPVPVAERRESRYVRSERPSSSVGEVTATSRSPHRIWCTDDADRSLPLLLATPGPAVRDLFDPVRGTVVALALTALAAVIAGVTVVASRRAAGSAPRPR